MSFLPSFRFLAACALVASSFALAMRVAATPTALARPTTSAPRPSTAPPSPRAVRGVVARPRPIDVEAGARRFRAFSFDGHVHTAYSHDARHPILDVLARAEHAGLDAVMITDHGTSAGQRDVSAYQGPLSVVVGAEMGGRFGHALVWRFLDAARLRGEEALTMPELGRAAHEVGSVVVLAHPGWWIPGNFTNPRYYLQYDTIRVNGAGAAVDAVEIWNGTYPAKTAALVDDWLALLDRSVYVPIVGGSDFHEVGGNELGEPRNVVLCEVDRSGRPIAPLAECILEAARVGRLYVTDGPSIALHVSGRVHGEVLALASETSLDVGVRVVADPGSVVSVYLGHTRFVRETLGATGELEVSRTVRAGGTDSYVWADVERPTRELKKPMRSLVTNPIRIDSAPFVVDFRGPPIDSPRRRAPPGYTRLGSRRVAHVPESR